MRTRLIVVGLALLALQACAGMSGLENLGALAEIVWPGPVAGV